MSEEPTPGYYIERIFAQHLAFDGVSPSESLPDKFRIDYAWEWTPADERSFFVVLAVRGSAGKDRPEAIAVSIAGKFRREGAPEKPTLIDFVKLNATTILAPYVREAFTSLSGRGLRPAYTLPPLNVVQMMENMKFETTSGAAQLMHRPDLVAAYGIPHDVVLRIAPPSGLQQEALTSGPNVTS